MHIKKLEQKWWVLMAMICSFAMVFVDQTAIPVALPEMQKELNTTAIMLTWVINAYLLSLAALTIIGGKFGDIYGHKKIFIYGLLLFIISSMMVGLAPNVHWVILGRALQGVGGAFMVPAMTVIITSQFKPNERGRAIGFLASAAAVFASLGPLAGGALTQYFSWRAVFWINVPFALISLFITLKMVPEKLHENTTQQLDLLGAGTLLIALFAFIFSVMETPHYGWDAPIILLGFFIGFTSFILFVYIELHHPSPLIELSLFKYKQIAIPMAIFVLIQGAYIVNIFWAIYFQVILNESAVTAGLMMSPVIIPVMFVPPLGGWLRDNYGSRLPIILGACLSTIGMLWITLFLPSRNYLLLLPGLVIAGSGIPLIMSSTMATAIQSVEIYQRGLVSGICGASRQIGSSLGLAAIGALIIFWNKTHLNFLLKKASPDLQNMTASQLDGLLTGAARAKAIVNHLPAVDIANIYEAARFSHIFALSRVMYIATFMCFIVLLLAIRLPKQQDEIQKV